MLRRKAEGRTGKQVLKQIGALVMGSPIELAIVLFICYRDLFDVELIYGEVPAGTENKVAVEKPNLYLTLHFHHLKASVSK